MRLELANGFNNFPHAEIPISHHCLDQYNVKHFRCQKLPEIFFGTPEAVKPPRHVRQGFGFCRKLLLEASPAESIAFSGNQMVEDGQAARAQPACDTEQTIRAEPEIKRREVVNR